MRIKLVSDLHFEFHKDKGDSFLENEYPEKTDVLVVAGDLADFAILEASVTKLCKRYEKALVIFVPGNHEFYGSSIANTINLLMKLSNSIPNFRCLYNGQLSHNGIKFFGTTLWFKYADDIEDLCPLINDFYYIENFAQQVYMQNQIALDFLWRVDMANAVVITHMLPSMQCVHPKWTRDELNLFFVCEVDEMIKSKSPLYWFHGHSHKSTDITIGTTRVVCNPMGYVRRDYNLDYNYELILNVRGDHD